MNIKTRFNLDQEVYIIENITIQEKEKCEFCDNGKISISGSTGEVKKVTCPECYGRGYDFKKGKEQWQITHKSKIGKVEYACYSQEARGEYKNKIEETYMIFDTGIGSGNYYHVNDIFATKEEAQAECEKRNK